MMKISFKPEKLAAKHLMNQALMKYNLDLSPNQLVIEDTVSDTPVNHHCIQNHV